MIKVYGASDDLIEIEGDIREEFSPRCEEPTYLAFSDGTVLRFDYTSDGLWKIYCIHTGSRKIVYEHQATDPDSDQYSDIVILDDITWVVCGDGHAKMD